MVSIITAIKKILQRLKLIDDYIVEHGTDGIWVYEKRASGKATLKGQNTFGSAAFTATGNVYYRNLSYIEFPEGFFIEVPYCTNVTVKMGNIGAAQCQADIDGISAAVLSAASTARAVTVYYYIEGKWK